MNKIEPVVQDDMVTSVTRFRDFVCVCFSFLPCAFPPLIFRFHFAQVNLYFVLWEFGDDCRWRRLLWVSESERLRRRRPRECLDRLLDVLKGKHFEANIFSVRIYFGVVYLRFCCVFLVVPMKRTRRKSILLNLTSNKFYKRRGVAHG